MKCLIHRWDRWEAPRTVRVRYTMWGKDLGTGHSEYQRQVCRRCGKVREREVTA